MWLSCTFLHIQMLEFVSIRGTLELGTGQWLHQYEPSTLSWIWVYYHGRSSNWGIFPKILNNLFQKFILNFSRPGPNMWWLKKQYIIKSILLDVTNCLTYTYFVFSLCGVSKVEPNLETSCIANTSQKVGNVQGNTGKPEQKQCIWNCLTFSMNSRKVMKTEGSLFGLRNLFLTSWLKSTPYRLSSQRYNPLLLKRVEIHLLI